MLVNSALHLASGIRNWHELTKALILLIGVVAYEMALHLPIKNNFVMVLAVYVPKQLLAFLAVWSTKFINPLAKSGARGLESRTKSRKIGKMFYRRLQIQLARPRK